MPNAYSPEQQKIIKTIKRIGRKRGEKRVKIKANLETGKVESNYRNLPGGDADSAGYRQERASLYGAGPKGPTNVKAAVNRFYDEADKLYHGQPAGQLAADVQRPRADLRGRYGQAGPEAKALLKGQGGQSRARKVPPRAAMTRTSTTTRTSNGHDARLAGLMDYIANRKHEGSGAALGLLASVDAVRQAQTPRTTTNTTKTTRVKGGPSGMQHTGADSARFHAAPPGRSPHALKQRTGTDTFEGHTVAAWIAPVLRYGRKHGWTGTVNSGVRTYAEQKAIYNSGVRPAAVPGTSNHEGTEFPRGAVDVDQAQQLSNILLKSPYAHLLQYAGAKDPVHLSHPHDGSY